MTRDTLSYSASDGKSEVSASDARAPVSPSWLSAAANSSAPASVSSPLIRMTPSDTSTEVERPLSLIATNPDPSTAETNC